MNREPLIKYIKKLPRRIFTSHEIAAVSGKSLSSVVQGLRHLQRHGAVIRLYRGVWAEAGPEPLSLPGLLPHLPSGHRLYVSFISALHLHGMIEQIPRELTCASLAHSRVIRTRIGNIPIHRIAPGFFFGFDWYNNAGEFLIASPEKAILDCCYLAGRRGKRYGHLPELSLSDNFDREKARRWAETIHDTRLRTFVLNRFDALVTASYDMHPHKTP